MSVKFDFYSFLRKSSGFVFEALKFFNSNTNLNNKLDLIISISKNEFRGAVTPTFLIQDFL